MRKSAEMIVSTVPPKNCLSCVARWRCIHCWRWRHTAAFGTLAFSKSCVGMLAPLLAFGLEAWSGKYQHRSSTQRVHGVMVLAKAWQHSRWARASREWPWKRPNCVVPNFYWFSETHMPRRFSSCLHRHLTTGAGARPNAAGAGAKYSTTRAGAMCSTTQACCRNGV